MIYALILLTAMVGPSASSIQAIASGAGIVRVPGELEPTPAQAQFVASLEGKTVTLKQPLYNVVDTSPDNPSIRYGHQSADSRGVTVVSPTKGTFLRYEYGSLVVADTDLDRLIAKIGRNRRGLSYKAGEAFTVRQRHGVYFYPQKIVIVLVNAVDADTQAQTSTALTIDWPTAISSDFSERGQVEALVSQFFSIQ